MNESKLNHKSMKTVISVSGGKTSAYLAANYPCDELVFSLVRTSSKDCEFKDRGLARHVSRRIDKEFIGTLEDDEIIHTILDLEQFIGKKIHWVTGPTFDEIINGTNGRLPSIFRRFCTSRLKVEPIFYWWYEFFEEAPVYMAMGFRANEKKRADTMKSKLNENGLGEFKATFSLHLNGRHIGKNKWINVPWRIPTFPLVEDFIYKVDIEKFWRNEKVRFAEFNNCVGCFHRKAALLKKMSIEHPNKFQWFVDAEKIGKGTWQTNLKYEKIKKMNFTLNLFGNESEGCQSGFCGF